jgi:hypothetical protein
MARIPHRVATAAPDMTRSAVFSPIGGRHRGPRPDLRVENSTPHAISRASRRDVLRTAGDGSEAFEHIPCLPANVGEVDAELVEINDVLASRSCGVV